MKKHLLGFLCLALLTSCNIEDKEMSWTNVLMTPMNVFFNEYTPFQIDENGNEKELPIYFAFDQAEIISYNYLHESYKTSLETKLNECKKEIVYLSMCFDRHTYFKKADGSLLHNVAYLNNHYGDEEFISLEKETYDLLKIAYDLTLKTEGKFNFCIGELSSLWDSYISQYKGRTIDITPSEEEINKALNNTPSIEEIKEIFTFDDVHKSVKFSRIEDKTISITFGGIAKGRVNDILSEIMDDEHSLFSLGQSSLTSYGDSYFDTWNISICNPLYPLRQKEDEFLHFAYQGKFSFSTSGDYQNYYLTSDGIQYHHIINPLTGYPTGVNVGNDLQNQSYHRSVSVFSNSNLDGASCDALSTALMMCSIEEGKTLSNLFNVKTIYMDDEDGIHCYVDSSLSDFVSIDEASEMKLSFF